MNCSFKSKNGINGTKNQSVYSEEWKKWSQKWYKASPKHKIGTIPFNPKQNGPITEESGKMSEATNQKVPGTQGSCSQGPKSLNLNKRLDKHNLYSKNDHRDNIRRSKVPKNTGSIGIKRSQKSNQQKS